MRTCHGRKFALSFGTSRCLLLRSERNHLGVDRGEKLVVLLHIEQRVLNLDLVLSGAHLESYGLEFVIGNGMKHDLVKVVKQLRLCTCMCVRAHAICRQIRVTSSRRFSRVVACRVLIFWYR